jgi:hypothetical protein
MGMMYKTINVNAAAGVQDQRFISNWTIQDLRQFYTNISKTGEVYSMLDARRIALNDFLRPVRDYPFSPPRMLQAIECGMIGTTNSTFELSAPEVGGSFSILSEMSFAGQVMTVSDCRGIVTLCEAMFIPGSNLVLLNDTHPVIMFGDVSTFYLRDIYFEIQSAEGNNQLHFTMSNPASDVSAAREIYAILEWHQRFPSYRMCEKDDTPIKFATITDPWVFTEIRQTFLADMCAGVDYA